MMKRFLSMIAILAISLLAACAQVPQGQGCKGCPTGAADCCGACPCGMMGGDMAASEGATTGKMCDPSKMKAKHHGKRHHKAAAAAAAPTAMKEAAKPTIPNQENTKPSSMMEGVKKIIKDVQSKDAKKPE